MIEPAASEIEFDGWRVPAEFRSDGCTLSPDKMSGRDLHRACTWHDWARRHLVHYDLITVQQADAELHAHLMSLGMGRALARLTWLCVKLARPWNRRTQPVPTLDWMVFTDETLV